MSSGSGSGRMVHLLMSTSRTVSKVSGPKPYKVVSYPVADSFELSEKFEFVRSVRFSCNQSDVDTFVVTTMNGIVFAQWVSAHSFISAAEF